MAAKKAESPLTGRETAVLRCVARHKSNEEIAQELVITEGTVKVHLHNIFDKLDLCRHTHARYRALEIAQQKGWLD